MKRTCRDGPEDIQDVVDDKSDIVTLILCQIFDGFWREGTQTMLALTTARNWGQLGSEGGGKRESNALELGT